MACGNPLENRLEDLAASGLDAENMNRNAAAQAGARFYEQLLALAPKDQLAVQQRMSELKYCSGATNTEQRTFVQPDGRKQVIIDH